ncbi:uncharacterized protein [Periplaneta americana]|uniref:uncharacterized protein n=1 Tax=Periplaneta americana TaxID=6978 RepID=UPI0037E8BB55
MIAYALAFLLAAGRLLAAENDGLLGLQTLETTLKLVSADSVNTVRAAVSPVIQTVNQTAQQARDVLEELGGGVAVAVLRARQSGLDVTNCAHEAEQVIQDAIAKLESCAGLAALEASRPIASIENLTQEAVMRLSQATEDVATCVFESGPLSCLLGVVMRVTQYVSFTTRAISQEALNAEESVVQVVNYMTSCATGQVQSARKLLQRLDLANCTS